MTDHQTAALSYSFDPAHWVSLLEPFFLFFFFFFNHPAHFPYLYFLTFSDTFFLPASSFSSVLPLFLSSDVIPLPFLSLPLFPNRPLSFLSLLISPISPNSTHIKSVWFPLSIHLLPLSVLSLHPLILWHIPPLPSPFSKCFPFFSLSVTPPPPTTHTHPPPQVLPSVGYSEASPLSDALVDHHLAKKAWGASWGQFGGRGAPLPSHHTWHFGRLQLQVHVLLERPDAGVHLDAQLVGRHLRGQARLSFPLFQNSGPFLSEIQSHQLVMHSWFRSYPDTKNFTDRLRLPQTQAFAEDKASSHIPFCCLCRLCAFLSFPLSPVLHGFRD